MFWVEADINVHTSNLNGTGYKPFYSKYGTEIFTITFGGYHLYMATIA